MTGSIEDVIARPARYAGHLVKLSGTLDECCGRECSICPRGITTADRDARRCLVMDFVPLVPGTGFGEAEQEAVFRFADVVIVGRFDPSCWSGLCLDKQTVLSDVRVRAVGRRRSSGEGLWLGDTRALSVLDDATARAVASAARDAGFDWVGPVRVFRASDGTVVACRSDLAGAPGSWPRTVEGALNASTNADFYRCAEAHRVGGRWVMQVAA